MALSFDQWLKTLGVIGALASFGFAVIQWKAKSDSEMRQLEGQSRRTAVARKVEATKPFLERQLLLYTEATQTAALLATTDDATDATDKRATALTRFWQLYWGELAMVENRAVEMAMKRFGDELKLNADGDQLQDLSLELAHACRASLDQSWGINAWTSPDKATRHD